MSQKNILEKLPSKVINAIRYIIPNFGFKKDDIYLSSYPKSGRNWLQFIIANALTISNNHDEVIDFHTKSKYISESYPEYPESVDFSRRIVSSHKVYQNQDVSTIYLVRHPADVMESYYHYLRGRWNKELGPFGSFIRSQDYGVPAWRRHVESWHGNYDVLIKYESMQGSTRRQALRILQFIGVYDQLKKDEIDEVIRRSSFEEMKKLEETNGLPRKKGANPNYKFMRSGKSDKGTAVFKDSHYRYLRAQCKSILDRLGYEVMPDV